MTATLVELPAGRTRRSAGRVLTETERANWVTVTTNWHAAGPKTEEKEAGNTALRLLLVSLFEDGVSLATLATAAASPDWNPGRIAGILHRCRQDGMLTGQRRVIKPAVTPKATFRRALTPIETERLKRLYDRLPERPGGSRGWKVPAARVLLTEIDRLTNDRVALETVGEAIGVKRQAIHQHLSAFRATIRPTV